MSSPSNQTLNLDLNFEQETPPEDLEQKIEIVPAKAQEIRVTDDKSLLNEVKDTFDPVIKKAHEAHKEALAQKKRHEAPLLKAESYIKNQISGYYAEIERKRREAEERERRRREEEERKRREAERILDEQKSSEIEQPDPEPEPEKEIIPPKPKMEGVSIKTTWKWKVLDEMQVPREFLTINEKKLNQYVREHKEKAKIPGIHIYPDRTVAARGD